jgi:carbonic anhydrase/acetyltransferase-like protein (isoleucine patch superfamily)
MLYALGDLRPTVAGSFYVAPDAAVIGEVHLAPNASVWFGAVVRGDVEPIRIGEGANVQDGCVLHADPGAPLILERFVTVGHQAMLHGCRVGENSLIGIASTVLNHARIGANSILGANALVTEGKEFPDGVLILGTPAKVARQLSDHEVAALPSYAQRYIDRAERYRRELRPLDQQALSCEP